MRISIKSILIGMIVLVVMTGSALAQVSDEPDYSLQWNRFDKLVTYRQYVVGLSSDGIVVGAFDENSAMYKEVSTLFLPMQISGVKRISDLLAITIDATWIRFIDLSALPEISILGDVNINREFADIELVGNKLYTSHWFDGVWVHQLDNYNSIQFVDSSMKGILVTQLMAENDTLYLLDEYNGILRYNLSTPAVFDLVDYMFIPFQARSFLKDDTSFYVSLWNSGLLKGYFDSGGGVVFDSLMGLPASKKVYRQDSLLMMVGDRHISLVNGANLSLQDSIRINATNFDGDIAFVNDTARLLLPFTTGGFFEFRFDSTWIPRQAFSRPGPVSDLIIYGDRLFTGGGGNPVDVYTLGSDGKPTFDTTISPGLNVISGFERTSDSLIVFYSHSINALTVYEGLNDPVAPYSLASRVDTDTLGFSDLTLLDQKIHDSLRLLLVTKETFMDVYILPDSGEIRLAGRWIFLGRVESFTVKNNNLFVITSKGILWTYNITDRLTIERLGSVPVMRGSVGILNYGNTLEIFSDNTITYVNCSDPSVPVVDSSFSLTLPVSDVLVHNEKMFTVGYNGIAIYSLMSGRPEFLMSGGRAGSRIEIGNRVIVTTFGSSVDIYNVGLLTDVEDETNLPREISLKQNYPNPFNSSTVIAYQLKSSANVNLEVYNSLGQKVCSLQEGWQHSGEQIVNWDGRNSAGATVASGIYFYRLIVDDQTVSKKMILLK